MEALLALIPSDMAFQMPFLLHLGLNVRVVAYTATLACLGVILCTLTAVLHIAFAQLRVGLAEGSRGSAGLTWRRSDRVWF